MFFKRVGLSREFQTGDPNFDRRVYVASDHPEFHAALRDDVESRKAIHGMIRDGFDRIWSNGHMLYASSKQPIDTDVWVPRLDRLRNALADAAARTPSRFGDPFTWRVLVVESIVWAMAGYAALAYIDYAFHRQLYHVDRVRLLLYGAACAVIIALGLFALIVLFLQRSSRSHRVLVESAVLLLLATPAVGGQLVSDINRGADAAVPIVVHAQVTRHWSEEHPRRRGGPRYSYHMELAPVPGEVPIAGTFEIPDEVFQTLSHGAVIPIALGRGRLGLRWHKSINGVPIAK